MFKKTLSLLVIVCFFLTSLGPIPKANADSLLDLPAPGSMINLSPAYEPVMIKGLTVHKDNPFLFDFIVDVGQDKMSGEPLKKEGEKLIKYFLASLAIPDRDVWVNLSPYEKNKMIPEALGQTDMGRDLLEQDYILKQITASLIYPEKQLGKTFWDKVYAKAQAQYGTTQIPVNTFNKVWIMADRAEVFEHNQTAFVVDSHLKVMLEEDYLALQKHQKINSNIDSSAAPQNDMHNVSSKIVKQIILPELEKEVNTGKNFANLRQIFNSIILSSWYKKNLKEALLNQVYANQSKIKGINLNDPTVKEQIYQQYLKAYKKGVFNYIKEEVNAAGEAMPRKYFSGGINEAMAAAPLVTTDAATLSVLQGENLVDFATLASTQQKTTESANPDAAILAGMPTPIALDVNKILGRGGERKLINYMNGVFGESNQQPNKIVLSSMVDQVDHYAAPMILPTIRPMVAIIKNDSGYWMSISIGSQRMRGALQPIVQGPYQYLGNNTKLVADFIIENLKYKGRVNFGTWAASQIPAYNGNLNMRVRLLAYQIYLIFATQGNNADTKFLEQEVRARLDTKTMIQSAKEEALQILQETGLIERKGKSLIFHYVGGYSVIAKLLGLDAAMITVISASNIAKNFDFQVMHELDPLPAKYGIETGGKLLLQILTGEDKDELALVKVLVNVHAPKHEQRDKFYILKVFLSLRAKIGFNLSGFSLFDTNSPQEDMAKYYKYLSDGQNEDQVIDIILENLNSTKENIELVNWIKGDLGLFNTLKGPFEKAWDEKQKELKGESAGALVTGVLVPEEYQTLEASLLPTFLDNLSQDQRKIAWKAVTDQLSPDQWPMDILGNDRMDGLRNLVTLWALAHGAQELFKDKGGKTLEVLASRLRGYIARSVAGAIDFKQFLDISYLPKELRDPYTIKSRLVGAKDIISANGTLSLKLSFEGLKKQLQGIFPELLPDQIDEMVRIFENPKRATKLEFSGNYEGTQKLAYEAVAEIAEKKFREVSKLFGNDLLQNSGNDLATQQAESQVTVAKENAPSHEKGWGLDRILHAPILDVQHAQGAKFYIINIKAPTLHSLPDDKKILNIGHLTLTGPDEKIAILVAKLKKISSKDYVGDSSPQDVVNFYFKKAQEYATDAAMKSEQKLIRTLGKKRPAVLKGNVKKIVPGFHNDYRQDLWRANSGLIFKAADKAQTNGGIDLNTSNGMQWKVSKDGQGVEMNIDPAMIARIQREGIDSLTPVVFKITPIVSIWPLVGLHAPVN